MADKEHLRILKRGVEAWNKWRDRTNILAAHMGLPWALVQLVI